MYEAYLRNFEIEGRGRPMKFTLKDYQADAVDDVLAHLERARKLYHDDVEPAGDVRRAHRTTGAGKTVMAAAVIEALFFGTDRFDFEPDPGAVVIWFSDDPNLNEQTRFRLMQASEKLTVVPARPRPSRRSRCRQLEPGQGLLPQHAAAVAHVAPHPGSRRERRRRRARRVHGSRTAGRARLDHLADDRQHDRRQDLTVYLILDEAHRGFNTKAAAREARRSSAA